MLRLSQGRIGSIPFAYFGMGAVAARLPSAPPVRSYDKIKAAGATLLNRELFRDRSREAGSISLECLQDIALLAACAGAHCL
jgi:hypothetical protein